MQTGTFNADLPISGKSSKATKSLSRFGEWMLLGNTGISVARAGANATRAKSDAAPSSVAVSVLDKAGLAKHGLSGLALSLVRTDGESSGAPIVMKLPTSALSQVYGADYASRIHWVQVPSSTTKTASDAVKYAAPVPSSLDSAGTVLAPTVSTKATLLVAMAAPVSATGTGNFTATPLSTAKLWDVSAQTGDFSWSYPLRTPPAAAGPQPSLSLSYDSQSVDGETSSTNNQPSAIGEGWSLSGGGFIERSYIPCSMDNGATGPKANSGDLCWKTDNATLSLGGHAGQLIQIGTTGVWRLQSDDGTRIQHVAGAPNCTSNGTYDSDCWVVTTTDGTRYFFGSRSASQSAWTVPVYGNDPGEPCNGTSWCMQGWRWNLDEVIDVHNNAEVYYYNAQNNIYSRGGTTATMYVRGGELDHIDYGMTAANVAVSKAASATVSFGYDPYGRCNDTTHANCTAEPVTGYATTPAHPANYTDVPYDQNCVSGTCATLLSPTFWSNSMLNTITTTSWSASVAAKVDVWTLTHSFPNPNDGGNPALWLTRIDHAGWVGGTSLSEPPTVFSGGTMQNRVWVTDGLAPLNRYRLTNIRSSLGASTTITYSSPQCTSAQAPTILANPWANTALCFPQTWTPPSNPPRTDLFNKFVVTSVASDPVNKTLNDAVQQTSYLYGTPGWRYETSPLVPDSQRTWSRFAGFSTVTVETGDPASPAAQKRTDFTFYQGLDKDRANASGGQKSVNLIDTTTPDSLWFAGRVADQKTYNGATASAATLISDSVSAPWASAPTATDPAGSAYMTGDGSTSTTTSSSSGANHQVTTTTTTTHEQSYGLPVSVDVQHSDNATPSCTTTTYAPANTTTWLIGLAARVVTVSKPCSSTPSLPADLVSDKQTLYDGATSITTTPSLGDVTETDVATGYSSGAPQYQRTGTTAYDSMGRMVSVIDGQNHKTTTAYTPAAGAAEPGSLTSETVTVTTAPVAWSTTTQYNPAWGAVTSSSDQNSKVTSATYDALGRRLGVWLPGNVQASHPSDPNTAYVYSLSQTVQSFVATTSLKATTKVTSYEIYDGLGQLLQTQEKSPGSGTVVSDHGYDSLGQPILTYNPYWTLSVNPSGTLFVPASGGNIPSVTTTNYDGAGRVTAVITSSMGAEKFRTSSAYPYGDQVDTTPPAGGTPTTTIANSLGQKTQLIQYQSAAPSGTAPKLITTYEYDNKGNLATMSDPVGNTWSWTYDLLGHQIASSDPDSGSTTTAYDLAGDILTSTDARGQTLAYTYDTLNRKTALYSGSPSGALLASWTYDSLSGAKGQPVSSTSYQGSVPGAPGTAYSDTITGYDAGYQPTGESITIPAGAPAFAGSSYTFTMAYNRDETPKSRTISAMGGLASEEIDYSYNANGLLSDTFGDDDYGSVSYSAIGQVAQIDRGLGVEVISGTSYDPATGAISSKTETEIANGTTTAPATLTYGRSANGDVTSLKNVGASGTDTQCFAYDYLENLTEAWTPADNSCSTAPSDSVALGGPAPYWTSYVVDDATGNRSQTVSHPTTSGGATTTDAYAYPSAGAQQPHAVSSVTTTGGSTSTKSFGYDASGNTTARPGQTLTWTPQGKIATVVANAVTQSDVYTADGSLLLQTDPVNGSTLFVGETQLHVAAGSSAVSAVRDYSVGGATTAERTTKPGVSGSVLYYLMTDANNTAYGESNAATGAYQRRLIDPYGNVRGPAMSWSSGNGYLNKHADPFDGLTDVGARAYDTALGKFVSVDTVLAPDNPEQNNGYAYSANNPITQSDPSGNEPTDPTCTTAACRNAYYGASPSGDGTDISNAPVAAGNGVSGGTQGERAKETSTVSISTHVAVAADSPDLPRIRTDYALALFALAKTHSHEQEANVWQYICAFQDPSICGAEALGAIAVGGTGWVRDAKGNWRLRAPTSNGASTASKTKWRDGKNDWRMDVENPEGGIGNLHLQSNVSGGKYYYDFRGSPGENNWYTEDGTQLAPRVFKRISSDRDYTRGVQKGWEQLGGEGPLRAIEGEPFESGEDDPIDDVGAP
jgi:RHS repeat-associated protein